MGKGAGKPEGGGGYKGKGKPEGRAGRWRSEWASRPADEGGNRFRNKGAGKGGGAKDSDAVGMLDKVLKQVGEAHKPGLTALKDAILTERKDQLEEMPLSVKLSKLESKIKAKKETIGRAEKHRGLMEEHLETAKKKLEDAGDALACRKLELGRFEKELADIASVKAALPACMADIETIQGHPECAAAMEAFMAIYSKIQRDKPKQDGYEDVQAEDGQGGDKAAQGGDTGAKPVVEETVDMDWDETELDGLVQESLKEQGETAPVQPVFQDDDEEDQRQAQEAEYHKALQVHRSKVESCRKASRSVLQRISKKPKRG